ncbi:methyltransferase domain-containing protein [Calothrix sp. FACHB-156]|nr:methyltransferase domain-containing protein [Calothrix sp. FACHB-156]
MTSIGTDSIKQELIKAERNKLHLGCGTKILEGYVNVDIFPAPGVDLACDINNGIPFKDNSFIEALAVDFIEHIQPTKAIFLMNEVHRVLKPGGVFKIHVPEAPGITAYQDPTHICFWNEESFDYYIDQHPRRENYGIYYGVTANFRKISVKRKSHLRRKFFTSFNFNYLTNYLLDVELEAVKS